MSKMLTVLLLFAFCCGFVSCSDNDDSSEGGGSAGDVSAYFEAGGKRIDFPYCYYYEDYHGESTELSFHFYTLDLMYYYNNPNKVKPGTYISHAVLSISGIESVSTGKVNIGGDTYNIMEVAPEVDLYLLWNEGGDDRERPWWGIDHDMESEVSITKNGKLSYTISAPDLNMVYDVNGDGIGSMDVDDVKQKAKFYASGTFMDISGVDDGEDDYDYAPAIKVKRVTNPSFIAFLKSLKKK